MLITIYTTILGLITGLTYSFALGFALEDGIIYGLAIGFGMGIFLWLLNRGIAARSSYARPVEVPLLSTYLMALLVLVSVGSGLIVWVFRVAIF